MELLALKSMLPQIDSPVESQTKALQMRQLMNAGQASDLEMEQRRQALADEKATREAYRLNPQDGKARLSALAGVSPKAYAAEAKAQSDLAKSSADTGETKLKTAKMQLDMAGQAFGYVRDNPTPENALSAIQYLARNGVYSPEQAAEYTQLVQSNPGNVRALAAQAFSAALDVKEQLMKVSTTDLGGNVQVTGTNPVTGAVVPLKTMAKTQSPDSIANNATSIENSKRSAASSKYSADSAANSAAARLNVEKQVPRGQIITTDQGVMLVDPRTGTSKAALGPDGQPLTPKMKPLPAPIQKALLENDAALRKVDDAMREVEAYPDALGLVNVLGDTVRQRTDPKGVKARALVADIGSLKIHDRSGAAVTAAETPRLKPFVPSANDNPENVKEKLKLFRKEYEDMQADINATYTQENGYRAPVGRGKPAPAAGGAIPSGWEVTEH